MKAVKQEILRKLGIDAAAEESFQILVAGLKTILECSGEQLEALAAWDAPVLPALSRLSSDELEFLEAELQKASAPIEECQVRVQKLIPQAERKRFAAYYTARQGVRFMASVAQEYLERSERREVVLADPFLGSGRTLTAAVENIGAERVLRVWGVEPLPLPALVAYASLLKAAGGRRSVVTVLVGDAFEEVPFAGLPKADVILTNPPFTRWKYLEKSYRNYLLKVVSGLGYGKYITRKESSLQTLSMFLSDYVLKEGGLVASVLPASTFYTIYGEGYKSLLRKKYRLLAVVGSTARPSFSEDSGFKEIITVAIKDGNEGELTAFIELDAEDDVERAAEIAMRTAGVAAGVKGGARLKTNLFDVRSLPRFLDINWLALFGEDELRDIVTSVFKQGLKRGTLGYWSDVLGRSSIVRGVEMYGPEFFFIPNKYWSVVEEENGFVVIRGGDGGGEELSIGKEFLVRTLRKPSLYGRRIEADVDSYMLSVPPVGLDELPGDLREYIKWGVGSGTAKPAVNAYGEYWYSHVRRQMTTKKPFGQVFMPDKVDLLFRNRGVFANYAEREVAASKNFYMVRGVSGRIAKFLIAWFNSTIFISVLALLGRRISETWTRFLENDYLELPAVDVRAMSDEDLLEVVKKVDQLLYRDLPPLWGQLGKEYRRELDVSIAEAIGVEEAEHMVRELHEILSNCFTKLQRADLNCS
ncbi:MAG: Type I restriction-modification system [Candidatus Alkanophagales archaeon MCA70_species_2]|nr:Type I restriction-modification system [Candidatus Alkanophaga liquidiphilum]